MMKVPKNLTDKRFINAIFSEEKGENFNFEVNDFGNIIKVPSKEEDAPTCRINLCEPPTHDNEIPQIIDGVKKFIVEFGAEKTNIKVYKNKKIKLNDIIGYIDDIPVKSKLNGKILEVHQKYIIGEYDTDIDEILGDLGLSRDMKQEDLQAKFKNDENVQNIIDSMEKYQQVVSFIKDYILKFRFADFATNTSNSGTTEDSSVIISAYMDEKKDVGYIRLISAYEDEIKNACDKDKIQTKCEQNELLSIKAEIDEINKRNINSIIQEYSQIKQGKYGFTKGKVSDYYLLEYYMNYITDSSVFTYDENNPYVVELFYNINNFITRRFMLEKNTLSLTAKMTEFKGQCDSTIRQYWVEKYGEYVDYYEKMKTIFKYDFYQANTEDYIKANINNEKRVTLYEKVLNYLKNLTKYEKPVNPEEQLSNSDDIESFLNLSDEEKNSDNKIEIIKNKIGSKPRVKDNLIDSLKKIAFNFVWLRKLETDKNNTNYYSEYINVDTLNQAKQFSDDTLKNYYDGTNANLSNENKQILKKYLGALKSITDEESRILRKLTDDAINWYTTNANKITSGELFDTLKEIDWPPKSIIKRNDEPYDFFYLENKNDLQNQQNDEQIENENEFTEDSVKTRYGIDSYMYWLKYCTMATIANCMMPMYWGTGIVISGAPILLPIIFIPIYPMPGRVTVLFGIGLCGMCPLPMIYFVNMSDTPGFMIPFINTLVDMLKQIPPKIMNISNDIIKESLNTMVKGNNERIDALKNSINEIDKEIKELSDGINDDVEAMKEMKKARKDDTTSHESKNQNQKKRKREKSQKQ